MVGDSFQFEGGGDALMVEKTSELCKVLEGKPCLPYPKFYWELIFLG